MVKRANKNGAHFTSVVVAQVVRRGGEPQRPCFSGVGAKCHMKCFVVKERASKVAQRTSGEQVVSTRGSIPEERNNVRKHAKEHSILFCVSRLVEAFGFHALFMATKVVLTNVYNTSVWVARRLALVKTRTDACTISAETEGTTPSGQSTLSKIRKNSSSAVRR